MSSIAAVPPAPRSPSTPMTYAFVKRRGAQVLLPVLFPLIFAVAGGFFAGPQVVEDLRLDFGEVQSVRGHLVELHAEKSSKGRLYAYCGDFVDDEGKGLSGTTCNLPLTTVTGPVELEVSGSLARVKGGRHFVAFIVGLMVFVEFIYLFVGLALSMRARAELRALREGIAVPGSVVGAQKLKNNQLRVRVRYRTNELTERDASVVIPSVPELDAGAQVVVLYDERRPGVIALWL